MSFFLRSVRSSNPSQKFGQRNLQSIVRAKPLASTPRLRHKQRFVGSGSSSIGIRANHQEHFAAEQSGIDNLLALLATERERAESLQIEVDRLRAEVNAHRIHITSESVNGNHIELDEMANIDLNPARDAFHTYSPSIEEHTDANRVELYENLSVEESTARRNPMMVPEFWTGEPTMDMSLATIDFSTVPAEERVNKVRETFDKYGIVLLRNTNMTNLDDMKMWAEVPMPGLMDYRGGANSRETITHNVYDTGAPKEAFIHYHHEMTYVSKSPRMIAFCCQAASEEGNTFVSDGVKASDEMLSSPLGKKLQEKGICYVRCLTDRNQFQETDKGWNARDEVGVYNHWQTSFGVETKEEVEQIAKAKGLDVTWGEDGYCITRYYVSAFEYCPELDKNILYLSIADDAIWFDTWPGLNDLPSMGYYKTATHNERPLKLLFGDDTELTREELEQFIRVYDNHGMKIKWNVGDVAVLCNFRWAHGRPSYSLKDGEKRELGVVLGEMFDRQGDLQGKW